MLQWRLESVVKEISVTRKSKALKKLWKIVRMEDESLADNYRESGRMWAPV